MLNEPMTVRAACHARINLDITAPQNTELFIEHLDDGQCLARECRPLARGVDFLDIKTHPEANQITCSLRVAGKPVTEAQFDVDCGEALTPVARHFIVVGAMKAGTTTLFQVLKQNSALCSTWAEVPEKSFTKEINYFNALYRKGDSPLHYDWRFPFDPARHAWTLDVSPDYAKLRASQGVAARIASLGGEVKLAYILREPVDRIESHIAHSLREGREVKNMQSCIRISRYALHLDRFTANIPRENILLLDFEQLRRDPNSLLVDICDFLGINHCTTRLLVHNKRSINFRLTSEQRAEFAEAVRPDVQRLISEYNFKPAEKWLHNASPSRFRMPSFRK
jgi:hypothetical protein